MTIIRFCNSLWSASSNLAKYIQLVYNYSEAIIVLVLRFNCWAWISHECWGWLSGYLIGLKRWMWRCFCCCFFIPNLKKSSPAADDTFKIHCDVIELLLIDPWALYPHLVKNQLKKSPTTTTTKITQNIVWAHFWHYPHQLGVSIDLVWQHTIMIELSPDVCVDDDNPLTRRLDICVYRIPIQLPPF